MTYNQTLIHLYFLLIYADGKVNEREIVSAKHMIKAEGIGETEFNSVLALAKLKDPDLILDECISSLKLIDQTKQIRIVAWLCVLANADGFMDRSEWQLIYRIYHKDLSLPLNEIFTIQKELNRIIWLTSSEIVNQKAI